MVDVDYAQSFLAIVSPAGPVLNREFAFKSPDGSVDEGDKSSVQRLCLRPALGSMVLEFMSLKDVESEIGSLYKLRFWGYCPDKRAAITPPPPSVAAKPASETKPPPEDQSSSDDTYNPFSIENGDDWFYFEDNSNSGDESQAPPPDPPPLPLRPAQTDPGGRWLNIKDGEIIQSSKSAIFRLESSPVTYEVSYVSLLGAGWRRVKLALGDDRKQVYVPILFESDVRRDDVGLGNYDYPGPDFEIRVIGSYREDGTIKFA